MTLDDLLDHSSNIWRNDGTFPPDRKTFRPTSVARHRGGGQVGTANAPPIMGEGR
jgi:hypothetical protein